MKKLKKITLISISVIILTFISFIAYRRIFFQYLFSTIARDFINNPIFAISYIIISGLYFLLLILQLMDKKIHKRFVIISALIYLPILVFILLGKSIGIRGIDLNILSIFIDLKESGLQCLLNMLVFIPIGLLVKSFNWKTTLIALFAITLIEASQYIFALGIFDITDIICNFLGILLGYQIRSIIKRANIKLV